MSEERDFETEAKTDGWMPQAEWKGDPNKWIPAEEFVRRGETIQPILNARLRKERERTENLERTVAELKEGNALFLEYHENTLKSEQVKRGQLIAELEETRKKAITEGDGATFTQADQKLHELRSEAPREEPKKPTKISPETQEWLNDNPWYQSDTVLRAIADAASDLIKIENPTLVGRAFLDKVTERTRAEVPHKFENPRRQERLVEDGQRKAAKKGNGYEDLPEDARKACDTFVKTIPGFTRDKYLKTYDWRE